MEKVFFLTFALMITLVLPIAAQGNFEEDTIKTSVGDLKITFIGHASLMFTFGGKIIHVDPFSQLADYVSLPKADIVLITHEHMDHLDMKALGSIRTEKSIVVLTETCAKQVKDIITKNGDVKTIGGLKIEAVPAYNIVHKMPNGQPFHPKGIGNGYVITFGDKRVYVAGIRKTSRK